jgi:hypothetical protein
VFDGHASRWNYEGLKYLLDHNVFCLCLPGHTSIWAQPNDGGPNASWKSKLGNALAAWREVHRYIPGYNNVCKMKRADFNGIFLTAWVQWQQQLEQERRGTGCNAVTAGWLGTGLEPYTRAAPFWDAAIAKFGKREELAQAVAHGKEPKPVVGGVKGVCLKALFEEHKQKRTLALSAASPTPATTTAIATTPATTALAVAADSNMSPEEGGRKLVMESAVKSTKAAVRVRTFKARLHAMAAGDSLSLHPIVDLTGEGEHSGGNILKEARATLIARETDYLLVSIPTG